MVGKSKLVNFLIFMEKFYTYWKWFNLLKNWSSNVSLVVTRLNFTVLSDYYSRIQKHSNWIKSESKVSSDTLLNVKIVNIVALFDFIWQYLENTQNHSINNVNFIALYEFYGKIQKYFKWFILHKNKITCIINGRTKKFYGTFRFLWHNCKLNRNNSIY